MIHHQIPAPTGDAMPLSASVTVQVSGGSVGDFAWNDLNENGIQDGGEPGVGGVQVTLYQGGQAVTSTATDGTGFYQFTDVAAGTYTVGFAIDGRAFSFTAQSRVSAYVPEQDAPVDAGPGGMAALWLLVAGLALTAISLLLR